VISKTALLCFRGGRESYSEWDIVLGFIVVCYIHLSRFQIGFWSIGETKPEPATIIRILSHAHHLNLCALAHEANLRAGANYSHPRDLHTGHAGWFWIYI